MIAVRMTLLLMWTGALAGCGPEGQLIETASTQVGGYAGQCQVWTGRHRQAVRAEIDDRPGPVPDGLEDAVVPHHAAFEMAGGDEERGRRVEFAEDGQGMGEIVQVAVVEGDQDRLVGQRPAAGARGRDAARAPPCDSCAHSQRRGNSSDTNSSATRPPGHRSRCDCHRS